MNCKFCEVEIDPNHKFCTMCGNRIPEGEEEELLVKYFKNGYTYEEIRNLLTLDGYDLSVRTLKGKYKRLGLSRKYSQNPNVLRNTLTVEIDGPCSQMGYRLLWHHLCLLVESLLRVIQL